MGIDIRMHVERKVGGAWQFVPGVGYDDRDSHLFQLLQREPVQVGSLRIDPPAANTGLPKDMSEHVRGVARDCGEFDFGHHHITLKELRAHDWQDFASIPPRLAQGGYSFVENIIPQLEGIGSPDNVRIVYWFNR